MANKSLGARASWSSAWGVLINATILLTRYPIFLLPIFTVWLIYAPFVLYLKYVFYPQHDNFYECAGALFAVIFIFSYSTLLSCAMVLEFIKQTESGHLHFFKAFIKVITIDAIKILPLAFVWAVIWFILTLIESLFRRKNDNDSNDFNAQGAAETIGGFQNFSWSTLISGALEEAIRMAMFFVMPILLWENLGLVQSVKKALAILKTRWAEFGRSYALTYTAAAILCIPPFIIFEFGKRNHGTPPLVVFPDWVWVGVIIYVGFAWSFWIYLEQMFMAQLYLWQTKWEKACEEAKRLNKPSPAFRDVPPPQILKDSINLSEFN